MAQVNLSRLALDQLPNLRAQAGGLHGGQFAVSELVRLSLGDLRADPVPVQRHWLRPGTAIRLLPSTDQRARSVTSSASASAAVPLQPAGHGDLAVAVDGGTSPTRIRHRSSTCTAGPGGRPLEQQPAHG